MERYPKLLEAKKKSDDSRLVNSHIQMPKLLLKRFHNKYNRFFYYDVQKGIVGTNGTSKSINTEYGYYSPSTEHFLRDYIETPFGKIIAYIEKIDFRQESFRMTSDFEEVTRNFIYALLARDPETVGEINKNSVFFQFLPSRTRHDIAARNGIAFAKKNNIFGEYVLTFMVNCTEIPFVLPLMGIYSYSINGHSMLNLPISSTKALCLVHQDYAERLIHSDGTISMFMINNPEQLWKMNFFAFAAQKKHNWGCVICPHREELDRLKMIVTD